MVEQSELETRWQLIDDDEGLQSAAAILAAGTGPLGVDAERASGYRYGSEAYLVQMYRRDAGNFLFDPVSISDFAPLREAVGDQEWILHAASQDMACLKEVGLLPTRIFDTELASRLLGYERVGLGAVVEQLLGIKLEKAYSSADWSTRPLPTEWLEYAALDVALLPDLRDAVLKDLEAQDKLDFALQEFEAVRTKPEKPRSEEPWRKLSGGHAIKTSRQLAIARELWLSRDELARERDVAPGRLVPDSSLVVAVVANPRSVDQLSRLKDFRGRASRTEIDRWWRAIKRGKLTEDLPGPKPKNTDAIPHHRNWAERHPAAAARLTAARAAVEAEAETLGMPVENLLTPEYLRRVSWSVPGDGGVDAIAAELRQLGARAWQAEITAPLIAQAFVDIV